MHPSSPPARAAPPPSPFPPVPPVLLPPHPCWPPLLCEAQLELTFILARLVIVLRFGVLSDRSTFTSFNARATDLLYRFFLGGVVVVKEVLSQALLVYF